MATFLEDQKLIQHEISDEMQNSYIDYAMSVIVGRALPDVRDGLKPVHRRKRSLCDTRYLRKEDYNKNGYIFRRSEADSA